MIGTCVARDLDVRIYFELLQLVTGFTVHSHVQKDSKFDLDIETINLEHAVAKLVSLTMPSL
jgi:hypothetical protein